MYPLIIFTLAKCTSTWWHYAVKMICDLRCLCDVIVYALNTMSLRLLAIIPLETSASCWGLILSIASWNAFCLFISKYKYEGFFKSCKISHKRVFLNLSLSGLYANKEPIEIWIFDQFSTLCSLDKVWRVLDMKNGMCFKIFNLSFEINIRDTC